jgi:hypothetical protein
MVHQALLKPVAECEYPEDFLVARLLGKKGRLFHNWEILISSNDSIESLRDMPFYPYLKNFSIPGVWHFLHNEHLWVYSRMNNRLRTQFAPYFSYHEINTLLICLRHLSNRNTTGRISQALYNSLLHNDIQNILCSDSEFTKMLYALELRLCVYSYHFSGLVSQYEKNGMRGVEVFLRDSFFGSFFSQKQSFLLKKFFSCVVDFYNCMSIAKSLRWQIETKPLTIPGGTVPIERFRKSYLRKDMTPVLQFLRLDDPKIAVATLPRLETSLLHYITFKLKTWSYQRTVVAVILFYLWEQFRYTRNISMILNTVLLENEPVRESLVA